MTTQIRSRLVRNEYADFELYQDDVAELDIRSLQLDAGPIRISHQEIVLDNLRIWRWSTNRRLSTTIAYPSGWASIAIAQGSKLSECVWCGVRPPASSMAVVRSGREHHFVEPAGWQAIEICLPEALLVDRGIVSSRLLDRAMAPEQGLFHLPPAYAHHLRAWLDSLFCCPSNGPWRYEQVPSDRLRERILDKIAEALDIAMDTAGHDLRLKPCRQFTLVRKAQSYIQDRDARVYSLGEMCRSIGTTPRTLQRSFRNVLGVSPYQYMLKVRLVRARSELSHSDELTCVTEVALRYGFCSTSDFSAHYKKLFAQLPSDRIRETKSSM